MQDYTYYFVPAPWLCVKLMKLLQCFPTSGKDILTHAPTFSLTHTLTHSLTHPHTHSPIHTLTHSPIHTHTLSPIHTLTHSPIHTLIHTHTHSPTHLLTHSLTHLFTHSLTHPSTHSFTHTLIIHARSKLQIPLTLFLLYLLSEDAIVKSRLVEAIDAILTKAQVIQIL